MELPPEVQQAYNDLISYCGGVEDLLQKSEEFRFYPECHSIMDVARYRLEHTVTNVLVWNVEQSGTDDFTVAYEVDQQVKEGEQTQAVTENYTVTVHVDKDGAMVITQNPTLAPAVQKSEYEPKAQEADASVSFHTEQVTEQLIINGEIEPARGFILCWQDAFYQYATFFHSSSVLSSNFEYEKSSRS